MLIDYLRKYLIAFMETYEYMSMLVCRKSSVHAYCIPVQIRRALFFDVAIWVSLSHTS